VAETGHNPARHNKGTDAAIDGEQERSVGNIGDSLDKAGAGTAIRPTSKGAPPRMRFLVKQHKGTRAVAELLGISQRTVERYVKGPFRKPHADRAPGSPVRSACGGSRE
jgi:hypothetical protein